MSGTAGTGGGRVFVTSDHHLGHARILRYAARPHGDVEKMNADLARRWNTVVGARDTVWVLGDWALGRAGEALGCTSWFAGSKVLVPGNHDRCWRGTGQGWEGRQERYRRAGFDRIEHDPRPWTVAGRTVRLSHFPYRGTGDSTPVERHGGHRLVDDGGWLLHGHVHTVWRLRNRMINVGVDAWGGYPVPLDTLAELIDRGPGDLPALAW